MLGSVVESPDCGHKRFYFVGHNILAHALHIWIHFSYHLPSPHHRDYSQHIIVIYIYFTMIWIMRAEYKVTQWYCNVSCNCAITTLHCCVYLCIFRFSFVFAFVFYCIRMNPVCRIQRNPVSLHCFFYLCVLSKHCVYLFTFLLYFCFVFVCNVGSSKKKVAMENR